MTELKHEASNKSLEPGELVRMAVEAKEYAYVPYSGFHVGAALLADNGIVYTGCNIENASYGATICAERTAIVKAVSDGARQILALAVASDSKAATMPCGICRQFMSEFCSLEMPLYLSDKDGKYETYSFDEILPHSFKKSDLGV